jgi:hypothetical protein
MQNTGMLCTRVLCISCIGCGIFSVYLCLKNVTTVYTAYSRVWFLVPYSFSSAKRAICLLVLGAMGRHIFACNVTLASCSNP